MPRSGLALFLVGLLGLAGCMQATLARPSEASLTPRDRQLLAHPPYAQATIPETYRRHIVDYSRREGPGTILIDTDTRYLYYVLPGGKAIRYGVAVGEEAMAWSGVAKVGRMLFDRVKMGSTVVVLAPHQGALLGRNQQPDYADVVDAASQNGRAVQHHNLKRG